MGAGFVRVSPAGCAHQSIDADSSTNKTKHTHTHTHIQRHSNIIVKEYDDLTLAVYTAAGGRR